MLRVLATIQKSRWNDQMGSQKNDLRSWIGEIMDGCKGFVVSLIILRDAWCAGRFQGMMRWEVGRKCAGHRPRDVTLCDL